MFPQFTAEIDASGRFDWGAGDECAGDELSVIAAVILGGTSLFGG